MSLSRAKNDKISIGQVVEMPIYTKPLKFSVDGMDFLRNGFIETNSANYSTEGGVFPKDIVVGNIIDNNQNVLPVSNANGYGGFAYNGILLAFRGAGRIARSVDKGVTWSEVFTGGLTATQSFRDAVYNPVSNKIVAVGDVGTIVTSSDNGLTWSTVSSGTSQVLSSIIVLNNGNVIVGGAGGVVLRSTDSSVTAFTSLTTGTGTRQIAYDPTSNLVIDVTSTLNYRYSTNNGDSYTTINVNMSLPLPNSTATGACFAFGRFYIFFTPILRDGSSAIAYSFSNAANPLADIKFHYADIFESTVISVNTTGNAAWVDEDGKCILVSFTGGLYATATDDGDFRLGKAYTNNTSNATSKFIYDSTDNVAFTPSGTSNRRLYIGENFIVNGAGMPSSPNTDRTTVNYVRIK